MGTRSASIGRPGARPGVRRILSGGQSGVDRAALDWALAEGLDHGGWCPRGRRAEDGRLQRRYRLRETRSPDPAVRTERNVREADATLVLSLAARVGGGSALTIDLARRCRRPWLHLHAGLGTGRAAARLRRWLCAHRVAVLNVAGPRASQEPGVGPWVGRVLRAALGARRAARRGCRSGFG